MALKKDPDGRRWVTAEVEVPGTPEQVWAAIATGPGVSSWFVPTEIREDGTIVSNFGPGMESVARRTAWDPPRRFAGESQMGPDGPTLATEWTVEARDGGTCVVRVVHSLFASTDDWDDQLEQIEGGWPDYFRILHLYLTHFRGMPSAGVPLLAFTTGTADAAWTAVARALGLEGAAVGDHRRAPEGVPPLSGWVERAGEPGHPHQVLLRLDVPTTGVAHLFAMAMGGAVIVSMRLYLYGDAAGAIAARDEPGWQAWIASLFPGAEPAAPACGP